MWDPVFHPYTKPECKVYVTVNVDFDEAGQMLPRWLIWEDGLRYDIDRVKAVCSTYAPRAGGNGDRYTIVVRGQLRYLYFEHSSPNDPKVGRWFIERRGP